MVETTDKSRLETAFAETFVPWARQVGLSGKLAFALALATFASGMATYTAWTGSAPQTPDPRVVLILLVIDLVLVLSLGALIARHMVRLWVARRAGSAGSRLHSRLVAMFSLVAVTPAIIVALFSAVFFHLGVQAWFSERVRTTVGGSLAVAEAYVAEHRHTIRADILAMANDIDRIAPRLRGKQQQFSRFLAIQASRRALSEATVFNSHGAVLGRTFLSVSAAFNELPLNRINAASRSDPVIFESDREDQVRALVRLDGFLDAYLFVARFVDPVVLNHVETTRAVVREYEALEGARTDIQLTSALIFIVVALMLLMAAIWLGLTFANRLVGPLRGLMVAAERIREGDLSARVTEGGSDDEIGSLSRAFNRMTRQLSEQREELVAANRAMDRRRRFTEAVLSGVSAGVVGLDGKGIITLPNSSAAALLETRVEALTGKSFAEAVPEMTELLQRARQNPGRIVEGEVSLIREGHRRTFMVRIRTDQTADQRFGAIVTFDDVTELVTAQRTAAWADVARRIAHEIKNPLTPIQLSAERLKRKYLNQISDDPEVFTQCTDTIIRQVGDIGRMVDEFSAFARMPAAEMKIEDLCEIVRSALFAEEFAHRDIDYAVDLPGVPVTIRCDSQHINRLLTNILQNAQEAIEARQPPDQGALAPGIINVDLIMDGPNAILDVRDNGIGLPAEGRERLTEPYVTNREKGTGLGLAIVKKIMEEHGGRMRLEDAKEGGARIHLSFPLYEKLNDEDVVRSGIA
ncbi:MAG: PAS domain-containing sensor histidine kinase [Rhodospirillaceae bacterium]|nr:PAS domain-containing sensor histidine kinase [Rhodospirillaceae bacterium]MBT5191811.1 PAS domain-containing sensor histidine kinase [Rhodospirillaceae bacterium]